MPQRLDHSLKAITSQATSNASSNHTNATSHQLFFIQHYSKVKTLATDVREADSIRNDGSQTVITTVT